MTKLPKLVFFGNERLATAATTTAPVLRALVAASFEIEAVYANHREPVSRQKRDLEIGPVAHANQIPVILPGEKESLFSKLQKHRTEAAVLVAFGQIIPRPVLDLFPKGIINVHPSLLPALRGPTPIETALLEGLEETGVSLMRLVPAMDAGPVYAQHKIKLSGNETKFQLAHKLGEVGAELLAANLAAILAGELEPIPQDDSAATYSRLLTKQDGWIDFNEPATLIERKVRAFLGFPKTRANIFGQEVIVTKARLADNQTDGELVMDCQPGWLEITELTGPSGRSMSGADFIRGYKKPN